MRFRWVTGHPTRQRSEHLAQHRRATRHSTKSLWLQLSNQPNGLGPFLRIRVNLNNLPGKPRDDLQMHMRQLGDYHNPWVTQYHL